MPLDSRVLPADVQVMPLDSRVLPADFQVMPLDGRVLSDDYHVKPLDGCVLPVAMLFSSDYQPEKLSTLNMILQHYLVFVESDGKLRQPIHQSHLKIPEFL